MTEICGNEATRITTDGQHPRCERPKGHDGHHGTMLPDGRFKIMWLESHNGE